MPRPGPVSRPHNAGSRRRMPPDTRITMDKKTASKSFCIRQTKKK